MVKKIFKKLFNFQTKTIPRAALILSLSGLGSILLGFWRDRLLFSRFGASNELDIYYTAFALPDFLNMLLVMGAISAAVIPLFNAYWQKNEKTARQYVSALLNCFIGLLLASALLFFFLAPLIISLIAPGFSPSKQEAVVNLTRIMLLSPLLLGLGNLISGLLQIFKRFLAASLAPLLYNLGIIIGIFFLVPIFGLTGLALGVLLGGFLHLLVQLPVFFRLGFRPRKIFWHPGIMPTLKLALPRSFGLAAGQINLMVIIALASTLSVGAVSVFHLANTLRRSIIILLAVPFATAVFPFLSIDFSRKRPAYFLKNLSLTFRLVFFVIIPASFLIFILRSQAVSFIFQTGRFLEADAGLTSAALGIFAFSLFAYSLVLLLSKAFYAVQNSLIPALVAFFTVFLNIVFSFLFIFLLQSNNFFQGFFQSFFHLPGADLPVLGLPLAFSLAGIVQVSLSFLFF